MPASQVRFVELDSIDDEDIDMSDIGQLGDDFFETAVLTTSADNVSDKFMVGRDGNIGAR